jgi:uncharacterized protein YkwD
MRFLLLMILTISSLSAQDFLLPPWAAIDRQQSDQKLEKVAAEYASVLVSWGRLSHLGPDGNRVGGRLLTQGFPPGKAGEVLGGGPDRQAIWEAWANSPRHREVLLDGHWQSYGAGMAAYEGGVVLVIIFFSKEDS